MAVPLLRLLAALATVSLAAADFTAGAQLGLALPLGDMPPLTDRKPGYTLALFGLWEYDEGLARRLRQPDPGPEPLGWLPAEPALAGGRCGALVQVQAVAAEPGFQVYDDRGHPGHGIHVLSAR